MGHPRGADVDLAGKGALLKVYKQIAVYFSSEAVSFSFRCDGFWLPAHDWALLKCVLLHLLLLLLRLDLEVVLNVL